MKCLPKQVLDQLNTLQKSFIWSNRKPKIKHSTLIADYGEGRYKDIDIDSKISALKITWVTRLSDTNFHPWKIIQNMLFSNIGDLEIMFHSNLKLPNYCASQLKRYPKFYQNLIQSWADVSEEESKDVSEICGEIIWNNRMITSNCQALPDIPKKFLFDLM